MKFTNNLITLFGGSDKMIHFLVGALIVALGFPFNWWTCLILLGVTIALSFLKEIIDSKEVNNKFDYKDLIAGCSGSTVSFIYYLLTLLI